MQLGEVSLQLSSSPAMSCKSCMRTVLSSARVEDAELEVLLQACSVQHALSPAMQRVSAVQVASAPTSACAARCNDC
jgi:hypothetical protein